MIPLNRRRRIKTQCVTVTPKLDRFDTFGNIGKLLLTDLNTYLTVKTNNPIQQSVQQSVT